MSDLQPTTIDGATPPPLRVLIVFYSRFGAIRAMAGHIQEGVARVPSTAVDLLEVDDAPCPELQGGATDEETRVRRTALLDRVAWADALVVGGPAYFGSLASPLKRFFEDLATASSEVLDRTRPWHHYLFRDKPGAAFASSATPHGGNEQALQSLLTMLMHLGMLVVTPGQRGPILEQRASPYGATAITGPGGHRGLSAAEVAEARDLGQRVAEIGGRLRRGGLLETERVVEARAALGQGFDPSA